MITVYHTTRELFTDAQFIFDEKELAEFAEKHFPQYLRTATVHTDSLDMAYEKTNTIHCNWTENNEVSATGKSLRSTSVGDIMYNHDTKEYHVVAMFGFNKLDRENLTVEVLAN